MPVGGKKNGNLELHIFIFNWLLHAIDCLYETSNYNEIWGAVSLPIIFLKMI